MDAVEFVARRLEELVDHGHRSWPDEVRSLIAGLQKEAAPAVEMWARANLAATPAPLRQSSQPRLTARRAILARTAAESAARCGRPQELVDQILGGWREGLESPARAIELLVELLRDDEAAVLGRYALARDPCPDGARIRAALNSLGAPPDRWHDAVLAFARAPSLEAWDDLMRFTPDDALYHRTRSALRALIRLGVDGDVLFRCATRHGTTPDAIELVERGLVDPETVVRRAGDAPRTARGLWLGLAARAALARGDRFRVVRLLREAIDVAHPDFPPLAEVWAIREAADDALNELLDKVGALAREVLAPQRPDLVRVEEAEAADALAVEVGLGHVAEVGEEPAGVGLSLAQTLSRAPWRTSARVTSATRDRDRAARRNSGCSSTGPEPPAPRRTRSSRTVRVLDL